MDETEYKNWSHLAEDGELCVYFTTKRRWPICGEKKCQAPKLAALVWDDYLGGKVVPHIRRREDREIEYLAVRRR
jgi:hypothetical protein